MGKEVKPECTKDILTESQKAKLLRETEASEGEHFARAGDHMRKNSPNPKPLKPKTFRALTKLSDRYPLLGSNPDARRLTLNPQPQTTS